MTGLDLNRPIEYIYASLRYFTKNEHHVTRFCRDHVLLMVFEGVLRFSEEGTQYEVHPGEYHIQRANTHQSGEIVSDSPKYLYVHFRGTVTDSEESLPLRGRFDYIELRSLMEELDRLSHGNGNMTELTGRFFMLLSSLQIKEEVRSPAEIMAEFVNETDLRDISLDALCQRFGFCKNHIIALFKKSFGITPQRYINSRKLERAEYLLEVTSNTIERIAMESGFEDYSHFYKMFKKRNGVSPMEYRIGKQHR